MSKVVNKGFVIKLSNPLLRIKLSVCFSFVTRYKFVRIYKRTDLSAPVWTPDTDKSVTNIFSHTPIFFSGVR